MITVQKPTLLLDQERVLHNIKRMVERARGSGVRLRPHFKTHQSAEIGNWFRPFGVEAITVSSVSMARYFAKHGWQDITLAFPTNILEIEAINQLAAQIKLGLLVESVETVQFLAQHLTHPVNLWIKIDVGYGRTGVDWLNTDALDALTTAIGSAPHLSLRGILTHAGHTYKARSRSEIEVTYHDFVFKMKAAKARLEEVGAGQIEISIGDTPSCSIVNDLSDVDEIRPGNFVFYDVMQRQIGTCRETDIAVAVACPVVAKHPDQGKLVIYGGAVHLSKEALLMGEQQIFGYVALPTPQGWGSRLENAVVTNLSQEHGLISADEATLNQIQVGDIVMVLPVHSCLTANLMRKYHTLEGDIIPLGDLDAP